MIEKISTKILDILEADSRLYAGGNAYATGWPGVKRADEDGDAAQGYVNLFDKAHDPDGQAHRPAIYLGTRAMEATDEIEFDTISSGGLVELRVMLVPLIICVLGDTKVDARRQRNQLRRNVKAILQEQIVVSGFWYQLRMPGGSGGVAAERVWTTATGGSPGQQVAEGMASVVCRVSYSWNSACDA